MTNVKNFSIEVLYISKGYWASSLPPSVKMFMTSRLSMVKKQITAEIINKPKNRKVPPVIINISVSVLSGEKRTPQVFIEYVNIIKVLLNLY